jgi:hypothetical protein
MVSSRAAAVTSTIARTAAAAALWALVFLVSVASAQQVTMTGVLDLTANYRPNVWQSVRLEIRNESDQAVDGAAVLPVGGSTGAAALSSGAAAAPATMRLPVHVPPRSLVRLHVGAYFPRLEISSGSKKQVDVPPLSVAEFRGGDGATLARTPIMGLPLSAKAGVQGEEERGQIILVVTGRADSDDVDATSSSPADESDVEALAATLTEKTDIPLTIASIAPDALTRDPQGLASVRAVVLEGVHPESLDLAQRGGLLNYLRGGGIVLLPRPTQSDATGWLEPLLPVHLLGARQAKQVEIEPGDGIKLRQPLTIAEAIDAEGSTVLLRNHDYVHVAARHVGLGELIFTSFPVNGLDVAQQPRAVKLWQAMLQLDQPQWDWSRTQLGAARISILSSMIGRTVAPWSMAAAVTGIYVLMIFAAQALFRGARRPRAFAASVGGAFAISALVLVMGATSRRGTGDQPLQAASLAIVDVAPDGGGTSRQTVAFAGKDLPDAPLKMADERATLRPAVSDSSNRPTIRQEPFVVDKAGIAISRIDRVWEAEAPVDANVKLSAVGRFGPDGLSVELDNALGAKLEAPLVLMAHRALSIADVPVGRSAVTSLRLNERGDYAGGAGGAIASELSKRRALALAASLTPAVRTISIDQSEPAPMLIGWLAAMKDAELVQLGTEQPTDAKSMVMVRTPLRIEAPKAGTIVSIPAGLTNVVTGKLAYDSAAGELLPSQEEGEWLIGFAAPSAIGRVKPTSIALEMRVSLPGHTMTVRKAQCRDGKAILNYGGDAIAEWKREVGLRRVSFDCAASDYDADGRVWLMLQVAGAAQGGGASATPWQIKDVAAAMKAEAVAPPKAIVLDPPAKPSETPGGEK